MGFPIRKFPDQSLFAAPRDLSQRTTSFIASQRQGIHRTPLRHLIALIAKARFRRRKTEDGIQKTDESVLCSPTSVLRRPTRLGLSKRPVLLQTHPGASAVKLGSRLDSSRRTENGKQRTDCSVVRHPSSVFRFDRMRFLFTMSDNPRPPARSFKSQPTGKSFSSKEALSAPIFSVPDPGGARRDRTDDLMLAKHALSGAENRGRRTEDG